LDCKCKTKNQKKINNVLINKTGKLSF